MKTVTQLRLDAQLAYLDGRVKRAKQLNRQADQLARDAKALSGVLQPGDSKQKTLKRVLED